jgi:hypothetical protein
MQELDFQQEVHPVQPEDNQGSGEVAEKSVHNDRAKELKPFRPQNALLRVPPAAKAQSHSPRRQPPSITIKNQRQTDHSQNQ